MAQDSHGAATALATVGTVCWCIQLIPQVIRNWYVRDCEGVPPLMFFSFAASGVPFAIYFVDQTANTAIMVQPYLFTFFSLIGFWQSLYYPPVSLTYSKSSVILVAVVAASVGIEIGCILPLRHLYREGTEWPNLIPGIIAAVSLAAGLLPPYWELFKRKGQVLGINFLFSSSDSSGAVFSTAAVAVQPGKLDILGLVSYIVVFVLEYGIMISHGIWAIRVRFFGLPVDAEEDIEEWEAIKREKAWPPKTQPMRNLVREYIAQPIARKISEMRLRLRRESTEDNDDACSEWPSEAPRTKNSKENVESP